MLTGSIGMLPRPRWTREARPYEQYMVPSRHCGKDVISPGNAMSVAMMLRYTFNLEVEASRIESAVKKVLAQGYRTEDIYETGTEKVGTAAMGDAVLANI